MQTIWQSLAWKEWHEHKWKLAAIVAVLAGCVTMLWSEEETRLLSHIQFAILLPIIPLTVLIATTSATSERSRGTLPFLSALPISPRKVASVKLISGLGTCLVPVLIMLVCLYVWYIYWGSLNGDYRTAFSRASREMPGPFGFSNWYLGVGSVATLWVTSMFLWTGVNRADEVSAGAVALSIIAGIWLVGIGISVARQQQQLEMWPDERSWARLVAIAIAFAPGGFAHSNLATLSGALALATFAIFVAVHSALAAWFVLRFGRVTESRIRSHRSIIPNRAHLDWLAPPHRSWLSAIVWKQLRESGPLVLAGLGGVAMIIAATLFAVTGFKSNVGNVADAFVGATFFSCVYLGGFTILIVGIGVFLRDLEPRLHTFWRSRPIEPTSWFWIKFLTGLLIAVVTFQLPMLILPAVVYLNPPTMNDFDGDVSVFRIQLLGLIAFIAIYAVAVSMTCLMRNAVYATVLTFAFLYLGALLLAGCVYVVQQMIGYEKPPFLLDEPEGTWIWIAGMTIAAVVSTLVAWLAVRNDWGRKTRY